MQKIRPVYVLAAVMAVYLCTLASCTNSGGVPTTTPQQQFSLDTTAIGKYLANNAIFVYHKNSSGIRFVVNSLGTGFPPRLDNEVRFSYSAALMSTGVTVLSGTEDATLSSFILGLQAGLSLLPKGSSATLYIPSGLAFGTQSGQGIPANANMIYEVTLTDVITTQAEKTQLASDITAVDQYLSTNNITAIQDTTGLRYVINTQGSGVVPSWLSKVSVTYTMKELTTGNTYYTGSVAPTATFDSRVVNYIRAFQVGLQKMHKGASATFYVPSGLAFGALGSSNGSITIPANTNIMVSIQLTDVSNQN